ncbi:MAG: aldehyde dehydrogenase family protein, partial [Polyangiaceae bacterium]|nr:aldehyde dehydrogenase family protein [Polyangiaceae bacterium]
GLCAAVHSLDEREQRTFAERIHAGNVYVNRGTTGAIVRRQPFGGWKASSFGPGAKAGGPGYVLEMLHAADAAFPEGGAPLPSAERLLCSLEGALESSLIDELRRAAGAYGKAFSRWYGEAHELIEVLGQENVFRYLPHESVTIAALAEHQPRALALALLASLTCSGKARVLALEGPRSSLVARLEESRLECVRLERLDMAGLEALLATGTLSRVRAVGAVPSALYEAAAKGGAHIESSPVLCAARAELPRYLIEQSISVEAHRFGALSPSLGLRGAASRHPNAGVC